MLRCVPSSRASQVDPKLQIEYASSWLEGRFMGVEPWLPLMYLRLAISYLSSSWGAAEVLSQDVSGLRQFT